MNDEQSAPETRGVAANLLAVVDLGAEIEGMAGHQLRPGVRWPEDKSSTHWLENRGTIAAVEISVDILSQK